MASVPVADTAEVEIRQMLFGQLIENTLYFVLTGGWDEASLLQLATTVSQWFVARILTNLSEDVTVREVVARDIAAGGTVEQTYIGDAGASGGGTSASAPSNVALAYGFKTALAGRSFRGRNYIGGWQLEAVGANSVSPTLANNVLDGYNNLQSDVTADIAGAVWSVVSRFSGGAPRVAGIATPVTVAVLTDYFVDSQRKRLTGRGQ